MKLTRHTLIICGIIFTLISIGFTRQSIGNNNSNRQIEENVQNLLNQMTLKEKINLLSGAGFTTKPNTRLGIPALVMTDGPLGPNGKGKATNYSACIGMAATWDELLIEKVGQAIGEETLGLGYNMILGPCINIARVPNGGRTFESFGEDPFLMSRMAIAYIKGIQHRGVITCTKHFICNNQEWNRFDVDIKVDERTLREIYLPAFKAAVQDADTWSIMAGYNQINGHYACDNEYLLTDLLKNEWGFAGIVVSDWDAIKNTIKTANAGLDLEMPNEKYMGEALLKAVKNGQVEESIINDKVRRLLRVMFKAGLFKESTEKKSGAVNTKEHQELALEVARKGIVLLKNEKKFLPLNKEKIESIAVIGPNANEAQLYGGGSGWLESFYKITPLEGLKNKVGDKIVVNFAKGIGVKRTELPIIESSALIPPNAEKNEHGLQGEYFNNRDVEGKPVLTRIDKQVDFNWKRESPAPGIVNLDKFSVRWTGKLISPGAGTYEIGVNADNGVRVYLDDKLLVDSWTDQAPDQLKSGYINLVANQKYDIRIEFYENIGEAMAKLGMAPYNADVEIAEAVELARKSDIVIICAGLDKDLEGEARDRDKLELPTDQINLIKAISDVNENIIVVLNNATPILMNEWIDKVPAIIEAWYPGQEGGNAIADILFGDVNPSGKLPLTFIKTWESSPIYNTYPGSKEVANYTEGIFVGYRYFDKYNIEPLFPFGHGLSYTDFSYSNLKIDQNSFINDGTIKIVLSVQNTGKIKGDEIVQLYVHDVESSVDRPIKELKGFKRITLKPEEKQVVSFELNRNSLAFYNAKEKKWIVEPGQFEIIVGSSSKDIRLKDIFELR